MVNYNEKYVLDNKGDVDMIVHEPVYHDNLLNEIGSDFQNGYDQLTTQFFSGKSSFYLVFFLCVFVMILYVLNVFSSSSLTGFSLNCVFLNFIELVLWIGVGIYFINHLAKTNDEERTKYVESIGKFVLHSLFDTASFLAVFAGMILFYIILFVFALLFEGGCRPFTMKLVEYGIWTILTTQLLSLGFKYIFGVHLENLFSVLRKETKVLSNQPADLRFPFPITQETSGNVIHVPGKYSYDEAKTVCKYTKNGTLASYSQLREANDTGKEWCDLGWSADQIGMFISQKKSCPDEKGMYGTFLPDVNEPHGINCYTDQKESFQNKKCSCCKKPQASIKYSELDNTMDHMNQYEHMYGSDPNGNNWMKI